jgi:hypothetical protein
LLSFNAAVVVTASVMDPDAELVHSFIDLVTRMAAAVTVPAPPQHTHIVHRQGTHDDVDDDRKALPPLPFDIV